MHKNDLIFISECATHLYTVILNCRACIKIALYHKLNICCFISNLLSIGVCRFSIIYFGTNSQLFFVSLMLQRQRAFSPPFLLTFVSFSLREMYKAAAVHTENLNHLRPVSFVLGALKAAADWSRGVQRAPP